MGEFTVEIGGESITVTAYKGDPEEDRLWVPFRDATSGEETYGAGRYIDLEPDHHRTDAGAWILDFNEAYNPTCPTRTGTSARFRRRRTGSRCGSKPAKRTSSCN
ncbi:hypothetical protein SY89_03521 [Halolamina pelagica]|uniref:Uncharacterized protein n=1 Tax=Halolamina pelagica TaxID=699431 RepID=A0A0P7GKZ9_9EURY|nr:hypothetical protein SY89_03521 [Halolamina pelagica]